jgi:unsaturated chondroitin disaccharide hydrolase
MRKDSSEFQINRKLRRRPMLDQIRPHASEFYLSQTATDGIRYRDTGAPGLHVLGDLYWQPAEPENDSEPVDSSAAVNAAKALLRLGAWRQAKGRDGERYHHAGLTVMKTLLGETLSEPRSRSRGLDLA